MKKKIIFWVILALFANFEAKCPGNSAKKQKLVFYERVLELPSNQVTSSLPEKICSGPPWLICIDIDFMKRIRITCYSF